MPKRLEPSQDRTGVDVSFCMEKISSPHCSGAWEDEGFPLDKLLKNRLSQGLL